MTTDQTGTVQEPTRNLLDTLLERWQEVADAYKTDPPRDDLDRTYADYRHIYLRNIRDLRHVLDTGRMPCSLMNTDERLRGDCGRNHQDEYDKAGDVELTTMSVADPWVEPERPTAREPWGPGITRDEAMAHVVTLHLAEALLDGKSEDVRTWARGLAHELKREQIDLLDDIGRHMQHMALGGPTSEVPF
ncbi:hypothetical protein GCM10010348_77480 [Streptomyces anthocyanicus]|uniref:hypothetical protein n=1 Tax=Streptomyces anthocyanicus TaxID=68174 RepID=UPI001875A38A|nr:hypothetical protein [Streptomyces anthocyanicus]GHC38607.1 hypothetical protein GCM10010348_77480 [Streptomyces anthocyanicus]